jgi:hypothetical protein
VAVLEMKVGTAKLPTFGIAWLPNFDSNQQQGTDFEFTDQLQNTRAVRENSD